MGNIDKFDNYKTLSQKDWESLSVNQKNTYLSNHYKYPKRHLLDHLKLNVEKIKEDYRRYRNGEMSNYYEDLTLATPSVRATKKTAKEAYYSSEDEDDTRTLTLQLKEAEARIKLLEHKLESLKGDSEKKVLKKENEKLKAENDELKSRINSVLGICNNMNKYMAKNLNNVSHLLGGE